MEQQQVTDSERMERIFARLYEKAMTTDKLDEPLLGPPGFVCREFADDQAADEQSDASWFWYWHWWGNTGECRRGRGDGHSGVHVVASSCHRALLLLEVLWH